MDTTQTKTTMRELLARWAAVEPGRCRLEENLDSFAVKSGKWWGLIRLSDLSPGTSPILIQAAVQDAIVARGWGYSSDFSRKSKRYYAAVITGDIRGEGFSDVNPVEALLSAYLQALEGNQ